MHNRTTLFTGLLFLSSLSSFAAETNQCQILPPVATISYDANLADEQQIKISSDKSAAIADRLAQFKGKVKINQGLRQISADQAQIDHLNQELKANGSLVFQDHMFTITAEDLRASLQNKQANLSEAKYWINGQQLHGSAEQLELNENNDLILNQADFTTCPDNDLAWILKAREIKLDSKEQWGAIKGAKLELYGVPIFYMPYMTVPISNKRKSGFLFPKFGTSTTKGVELGLPYYWNISPQYDATITPHYMSNRGLHLKTEFRYLAGEAQLGQFNIEYLDADQKLLGKPERYLYHWQHAGKINDNWRIHANYTDISDNNYFNDLRSDVNRSTSNQLYRVGEVDYFQENWNFSAKVQDIKVLGVTESPYQVLPQLNFNYRQDNFYSLIDFKFNSELTQFSHQNKLYNSATRLHLEPSLTLPLHSPQGSLLSEVKLMQTFYNQSAGVNPDTGLTDLTRSVDRFIPQVKVHGKLNLERDSNLFGANFRQTLEPQIQYLFVDDVDQSNIGIYDTSLLYQDFDGLFRDRSFSGLDRIAAANQFTLGLTSRFFDSANIEKSRFSLGQIFYLDQNTNNLFKNVTSQTGRSALAAEVDLHLTKDWVFSSAMQYDTDNESTKRSEVTLDYRPGTDKLMQMSYRYVPDLAKEADIAQAGLRTVWPINDKVNFVGNFYYDLNERRSVETYTGFQYETCCWSIRLAYHRHIKTNYADQNLPPIEQRDLFEEGVSLSFSIKGLGGSNRNSIDDMLNEGLFNYRRPLYLKN
ncbi:LPS assembly protein LptD [Paraferrimonas sp. SM1919]|uniref:LPS assembly protein LptD n=1 Tax=Paraferrimonas sp. SM1919 TaxID=2662263 RepID=UPI0013D5E8F1|nr:LPS assembly protein LptD [Paraferrimonas sp. SM1919]